MTSQRGVALILALMVLAFLTVLGGALLTTTTIDVRVSDNFKTAAQSLHLAEAGIEHGREFLRRALDSPTQLLANAAGVDGILASADDVPLVSGDLTGHYGVSLRNDNADGLTNTVDTNGVLRLLSSGKIGNAERTLDVSVRRATVDVKDRSLVARISANATDIFNPPPGTAQSLADIGSPGNYRIAVVNGDANLGSGAGYGILLVRGNVSVEGSFSWNGFIVVATPGAIRWNATDGRVNGGVLVGQTRIAEDWIQEDALTMAAANRLLPYIPITIRER